MRYVRCTVLIVVVASVVGCGASSDPNNAPVSGKVTLNDQPAGMCELTYIPQGDTKGNGGKGLTDSTGRYEIRSLQGKPGIAVGSYKVVVNRRLNPDGTPPKPDESPIESQARETLPPTYSSADRTTLTVVVPAGGTKTADFALKAAVKK